MNNFRKLTIAVAALIAATSSAAAEDSCSEMQVYLGISPKHRDNVMSYIAPRLKEKFGTNLVAEEIGSAAMVEKLSAQGDHPRVTIAHWDAPIGIQACGRDLCKPIDMARIPNASTLYDWAVYRNPQKEVEVLTSGAVAVGLAFNEEAFKKAKLAPPTSWNDLNRPELKGRVSITHPNSTWGDAMLVMLARLHGGGETNIDPGFAAVQDIMSNVLQVHTWSSELSNLLQLGEVWLATTGSILIPPLREKGLTVSWIAPKEGSPLVNSGVSLVKNAPCENVAYEYLNLYFSPEFQTMRETEGGIASANKGVWESLPKDAQAKASLSPADYAKAVTLDWAQINKVRQQWIARWQREVR